MPSEILDLTRRGFTLSGKHGSLIYRTRGQSTHIYGLRASNKENHMAKIKYASFVAGLSGKSGASVFFRSHSTGFGYLRSFTYPKLTTVNALRGAEFKNLTEQLKFVSALGIADLKEYAAKYRNLPQVGAGDLSARANNHVAIWIMAVHNCAKDNALSLDVSTVTLTDLKTLFAFTDVASVVNQGWLPAVPGWEDLTNPFKA